MSTSLHAHVNWVTVEATDDLCTELRAYCELRRLLPLWLTTLKNKVRKDQSLVTVERIIKNLPPAAQMLEGSYAEYSTAALAVAASGGMPAWVNRPWVWRCNKAYCEFSNTNHFSRTWLMVTLASVLQALQDLQRNFTTAEQHKPTPTYDKLEAAYHTWKMLAEKHATKPTVAQLRERETGQKNVKHRKMGEMLRSLERLC